MLYREILANFKFLPPACDHIWNVAECNLLFPLLLFLPLLVSLFIRNYTSFVLALFSPFPSSHTSIPLSLHPSVYVAFSMLARASLFPCWFLASSPPLRFLLLFTHPHLPPPLLFFFPFCMCARVRGARQSVQPSGLKVNTYVIANCLQSLGAALKKDMLCRQLRPLAFASLSDRICFKGLVHIIFNPRALCALWTTGEKDRGYTIYAQHEKCMKTDIYRISHGVTCTKVDFFFYV